MMVRNRCTCFNKLFYSGRCEFQLTQPFHIQIWSLEITIANWSVCSKMALREFWIFYFKTLTINLAYGKLVNMLGGHS